MFKLKDHHTTPAVEIAAGLTTFCAMVYCLAANPAILALTGAPADGLFTATALSAIAGSLLMALSANLPFAVGPGMGINAIFAFTVVLGLGYTWPQALAATLSAGLLFVALSLSPLRERIIRDIPPSLQYAVCGGVGLLIAGLGLLNSQVVTVVNGLPSLGDFHRPEMRLALVGLFLTALLLALKFRYAVLAGIILTTLIGLPLGVTQAPAGAWLSLPPAPERLFCFDFSLAASFDFISAVLVFLFLAVFDSLAGFLGLFSIMGEEEARRYRPKLGRAFLADSLAIVASSCLGCSPNTAYAESGAGVASGGRTGLSALVTALCFTAALFCAPIFLAIPFAAVAPALVVVGWYMLSPLVRIDFSDATESFPAVLLLVLIGLSWKISDSLALAWLTYMLMKTISGRKAELNATVCVVGAIFAGKLAVSILA